MAHNSLTDAPRNFREGIDWLLALKGTDAEDNLKALGTALYDFLSKPHPGSTQIQSLENVKNASKTFMADQEFKDQKPIQNTLGMLIGTVKRTPGEFTNSKRLTAETIAEKLSNVADACDQFLDDIKDHNQYNSAYGAEATWDASCAKDPEACAVVLVGMAPMLYAGIQSLRKMSNRGMWLDQNYVECKRVRALVKAFGYDRLEVRSLMTDSYVSWALRSINKKTLATLKDLAGICAFY
ncbi:hypothetical protein BBBOND_0302650 [Babesia bigemina]|uniref:Uncharacterized protein n=1 Tax=Babesia bigemina TaxID=5866 RepID=A0A061D6P7_BABBI|nr:hypothetical protein BBBOND_0302650 [Babesia bigemina]CDR96361.1 hypothetical protein BBBOND_0302650 [Babesia bigemina]|eukprot:XP_012768547.1 hypothetical protein BBBOND_0302650 [Babesia bigemina]